MINIELRTYIKITCIILHLTLVPLAFASINVEISTDQNITLDLLFSPDPQQYILEKGEHRIDIGIKPPISPELDYLQSDELVDWNSAQVQKMFGHLQGTNTEIVMQAIQIIHEEITYNLSSIAAEGSQKVSWVIDNKEGVCDEITATLIAAARSHSIPARFVHGYAYTTSDLFQEPWQPHTWAEVFLDDKWVAIDITFHQYNEMTDNHVPFVISNTMDQNQYSVKYFGDAPNIQIEYNIAYTPNTTSGTSDYNVQIPNMVHHSSDIPLTIFAKDNTIKSLQIGAPENFEVIAPAVMQKKVQAWIIPPTLSEQYEYTIPITIRIDNTQNEYSVVMNDEETYYTYQENDINSLFWCEFTTELTCYSDTETEICLDKCYTLNEKGSVIDTDNNIGMNYVYGTVDNEPINIRFYVPPKDNLECTIDNQTLAITATNKQYEVQIEIMSPFQKQVLTYDVISNTILHNIDFREYFDGMPIQASVSSNTTNVTCDTEIELKVEGWDWIPNIFYKFVSKIISYA